MDLMCWDNCFVDYFVFIPKDSLLEVFVVVYDGIIGIVLILNFEMSCSSWTALKIATVHGGSRHCCSS